MSEKYLYKKAFEYVWAIEELSFITSPRLPVTRKEPFIAGEGGAGLSEDEDFSTCNFYGKLAGVASMKRIPPPIEL